MHARWGEFLVGLGEQLRDGEELTLVDEEWKLPFAFGDAIEVEILGRTAESAPDVR